MYKVAIFSKRQIKLFKTPYKLLMIVMNLSGVKDQDAEL